MLGENISRIRKEKGLTQEALATKLNAVRQTVSKWETGIAVPDAETLCKIADALDVSVADLLGRTDENHGDDYDEITNTLAQINEQLAIKNRQSKRIGNIILSLVCIFIGVPLLITLLSLIGAGVYGVKADSIVVYSAEDTAAPAQIHAVSDSGNSYTLALFCIIAVLVLLAGMLIYYLRRKKRNY